MGVTWLTVVEGDPKALFSIVTEPSCWEGRYTFPCIASLILDPFLKILSIKQGGIKYHFFSLWYDSNRD